MANMTKYFLLCAPAYHVSTTQALVNTCQQCALVLCAHLSLLSPDTVMTAPRPLLRQTKSTAGEKRAPLNLSFPCLGQIGSRRLQTHVRTVSGAPPSQRENSPRGADLFPNHNQPAHWFHVPQMTPLDRARVQPGPNNASLSMSRDRSSTAFVSLCGMVRGATTKIAYNI